MTARHAVVRRDERTADLGKFNNQFIERDGRILIPVAL